MTLMGCVVRELCHILNMIDRHVHLEHCCRGGLKAVEPEASCARPCPGGSLVVVGGVMHCECCFVVWSCYGSLPLPADLRVC
jgi:hypothetical protein